jgi:hypothetical protein
MNLRLSTEATEFGQVALQALGAAGGDELIQDAEREPGKRTQTVGSVLAEIGVWDLNPRREPDDLEAAAAVCRSAGWWCAPDPVAERLARPHDLSPEVDGLVVVGNERPAAALGDVDGRWAAVTLDGTRSIAAPRPATEGPRYSAFVADLDLAPIDNEGLGDVALALVLPCWTLLGMLDRAIALTRQHVLEREQFGQPLARFQSVQFQLTDAEVERAGVEELAKYALGTCTDSGPDAIDDALSLRLAAIEAADTVFRVTHQLHGAIGFCDETALSWLSRYSRPLRRLPFDATATRVQLTNRLGNRGLTGLFCEPRG